MLFLINCYYDKRYGKIVSSALRQKSKIYKGKTHADCFVQEPKGVLRLAEQGFLTERGKFVNRKTALRIAKHYKQIKTKHQPEDILFSEDLMDFERR